MNQWPGGFQGEVTVTAGASGLSGWTVGLTFPNGQTIQSAWNAQVTSSGSTATATNMPYNGTVAAGQSAGFGFLGSWNGTTNGAPTLTCTAS